jgi:hypothetical protein
VSAQEFSRDVVEIHGGKLLGERTLGNGEEDEVFVTVIAVARKSDTEDQYMIMDCLLKLVFARLDGGSWFGSVVHLADESSLLVLEVRDGVIVLHAMSFSSSIWLWLYALESSRWMPRASIRPGGRSVLSR